LPELINALKPVRAHICRGRKSEEVIAALFQELVSFQESSATDKKLAAPARHHGTCRPGTPPDASSLMNLLPALTLLVALPLNLFAAPDPVSLETIQAAAEMGGDEFVPPLLKFAAGSEETLRRAAIEALTSRPAWTRRMLEEMRSGKIAAAGFPVPLRRSLAGHPDESLRKLANEVLGLWNESNADVTALIARKRKAALTGEPNMENGKLLFTTTCATCHKFHGGGHEVGPELIGSGRSNLDALLANIIDPNQIIGNGYENFIISTKDGRTVAGRVIEDTPTQMTLLGIGGVKTVLPRAEIAKVENTRQSLMPMGFGELPDEQFRDLVWFILAPPEEGPLTKEKKEELLLSLENETRPAAKSDGSDMANPNYRDRESASLWNVDWGLDAPDFEGTPSKLVDYHGRKHVLVLHPKSRTDASALVRTLELPADRAVKVSVWVASHNDGDWECAATCNGELLPGTTKVANSGKDRWKKLSWDLSAWKGKKVTLRLEGRANNWSAEFSYWSDLRIE
jgi:putative heme-binding domain-containing protein